MVQSGRKWRVRRRNVDVVIEIEQSVVRGRVETKMLFDHFLV